MKEISAMSKDEIVDEICSADDTADRAFIMGFDREQLEECLAELRSVEV